MRANSRRDRISCCVQPVRILQNWGKLLHLPCLNPWVSNLSDRCDVFIRKIADRLRSLCRRIAQHDAVAKARKYVEHHYDLSDELYKLFLDEGMQYSCAYLEMPYETLEKTQLRKKNHIATKLLLRPGHAVLDIGSG